MNAGCQPLIVTNKIEYIAALNSCVETQLDPFINFLQKQTATKSAITSLEQTSIYAPLDPQWQCAVTKLFEKIQPGSNESLGAIQQLIDLVANKLTLKETIT